jgi:small conductance mechanosensitive channel
MSGTAFDYLWREIVGAVPMIVAGFVIFAAAWVLAVIARGMMRRLADSLVRRGNRADLLDLLGSVVFWTVVALGLVIGLGTMGVNVSALVASLGLTGFALGFALRDAIANLLAGILIIAYQPFRYGDRIKVTDIEGVVAHIDLRYTTLEDGGARHLVPNQTMYSNPVTVMKPGAEGSA